MFALELGGKEYAWNSTVIIGLFTTVVITLIIFFFVERKATEPIISFHLFKNLYSLTSQGVAFFYGLTFIICTVYIPIFIQGVLGGSASNAGLILTPMMVGSVIGSQTGGQLASRTSYRNIMMVSRCLLRSWYLFIKYFNNGHTSFTRNTIYDSRWAWCWFLILSIKYVFYSQVGNAG